MQSVHIGEENLIRHVKKFHEGIKKPCPKCGKDLGIANMSKVSFSPQISSANRICMLAKLPVPDTSVH